ncbi:MAG: holo-ACP synthase [Albidovulum sp.]|nr:holo-ACP synthase [Albidovulum sp.]MDE0531920.1 holo-ACP synthase [Albidovulum sp.]
MIIGIGIDVVRIDRIERVLEHFGDRFRHRVFTVREQRRADGFNDFPGYYAKRWAAKEACAKALGTGMRKGVAWRNIEVESRPGGMPTLKLHGAALARLQYLTPRGCKFHTHLSMTDDRPVASAIVVIEALPRK